MNCRHCGAVIIRNLDPFQPGDWTHYRAADCYPAEPIEEHPYMDKLDEDERTGN